MTANVHRRRQPGDMGGKRLNVYRQGGHSASEALGSDAQAVDFIQHSLFHLPVKRVWVAALHIPAEGFFGQIGAKLKIAAQSHAHYDRAGRDCSPPG